MIPSNVGPERKKKKTFQKTNISSNFSLKERDTNTHTQAKLWHNFGIKGNIIIIIYTKKNNQSFVTLKSKMKKYVGEYQMRCRK